MLDSTRAPETSGAEAPARRLRIARTGLGLLGGLTLASAAVWVLGVRPSEVLARASAVPPWAIVLCVASGWVVLALQTLRWHQIMLPLLGLRYGEAFCAQTIGGMLNAILPARGGDLLRAQYLGNLTQKSRATILGTEVVDRWLDWWGWVPVVAVLAMTSSLPTWIHLAVAVFGAALVTWGAAMVFVCKRRHRVAHDSRIAGIASSFRAGLDAFASRRTLILALLVAPLPWVWEAAVIAIASQGFGIHLTFAMSFCVLVGFNTATVVPAPGGIGALETGGAAVLLLFGVNHASALAFLFVYHLTQLLPMVVGGATLLALRPLPVLAGFSPKR